MVAPTSLTIQGDYTNNSTFSSNGGKINVSSQIIEYLAGRDASGDAAGALGGRTYSLAIKGDFLYTGGQLITTACSQTAGSALGCELKVFDISDPTNPIYVAGRDDSGDASGTDAENVNALTIK